MSRPLRLALALGALISIGVLLWRRYAQGPWESTPQPDWPPLDPAPAPSADPAGPADPAEPAGLEWLAAEGGACPESHPVKANPRSMVFHVPGGRSYDRTQAGRCYPTAEAAERDGYRQAKA
jgi:hypothetical protein